MTVRLCTRCQKPYGAAIDGVISAAHDYAPFCSKRCADVDLVHWLKGDYVIDGTGSLALSEDAEEIDTPVARDDDAEA